jgi:hypothetical protein
MHLTLYDARLDIEIQISGLRGTSVTLALTKDWAGVGNIGSREFAAYFNLVCKVDDKWVFNAPQLGTEVKQHTRFIYLGLVNIYYDTQPKPPQNTQLGLKFP